MWVPCGGPGHLSTYFGKPGPSFITLTPVSEWWSEDTLLVGKIQELGKELFDHSIFLCLDDVRGLSNGKLRLEKRQMLFSAKEI